MSNVANDQAESSANRGEKGLHDASAHADEIRALVSRKAAELDDQELFLAVRSLEELNEHLSKVASEI